MLTDNMMNMAFWLRWRLNGLKIVLINVFIWTALLTYFWKQQDTTEAETCPINATLALPRRENFKIVSNYLVGDSQSYLAALGLARFTEITDFYGHPVVITTGSETYFSRLRGWLQHLIQTMKPKLRIVIYDIGFTDQQQKQICGKNECEIRVFPFHRFPAFVKDCLLCTAWKPLAIQLALEEFGFIIWMDAAVHLIDGDIHAGIDRATENGIAIGHEKYGGPEVKLTQETIPEMFQALGEHACAFEHSDSISASLLFIRKNAFSYRYIMRPWVSCALTKVCIAGGKALQNKCKFSSNYKLCHRFAQSILSIILNRLYYSNLNKVDLRDNVKWRKCYIGQTHVVIDDIVFPHYERRDIVRCPDDFENQDLMLLILSVFLCSILIVCMMIFIKMEDSGQGRQGRNPFERHWS